MSSRARFRLAVALALVCLGHSLMGCGPVQKLLGKKLGGSRMSFTFKSIPETNDGRAVHGVIKAVTDQEFLVDSYERVSDAAYASPPAEGVLRTFAIVPGQTRKVSVEKEREKAVGVYLLFSEPGEQWKILIPSPVKSKYRLKLDKNSVKQL